MTGVGSMRENGESKTRPGRTMMRPVRWPLLVSAILVLLWAGAAYPADYYIDAGTGSDANSGTSPSKPWKSLYNVRHRHFSPGDTISLKRGETWRETLHINSSGAAGRPIVIGAYGSGERPLILGSDSKASPSAWTMEAPGLWYTGGVQKRPQMIFHDGVGSVRRNAKGELSAPWDWWYDPARRRLYVRLDDNPGKHAVELAARNGVGFSPASHITLRDLEIAYAEFGVGLWGASHWVIENVSIHDVTEVCVQGNNASRHVTVRNSDFRDWNWRGFRAKPGAGEAFMGYGVQVIHPDSSGASDNWVISGNRFRIVNMESGEDTTAVNIDRQGHASLIADNTITGARRTAGGIMVWRPKGTAPTVIRGNVLKDLGQIGILLQEFNVNNFTAGAVVERNVLTNTCTGDHEDQEALRVWPMNGAPVTVRNNLVNGTRAGRFAHEGIKVREAGAASLYNNTVTGTDIGLSVQRRSSRVVVKNNISAGNRVAALQVDGTSTVIEGHNLFSGKILGLSLSASSLAADPGFTDAGRGNFRLRPSSPAIDRGADMGAGHTDLEGTARPQGKGWDIGAYEHSPGGAAGKSLPQDRAPRSGE